MSLNGRVGKIEAYSQALIFGRESEERGKGELFDGGRKRTSSVLNLPLLTFNGRLLRRSRITGCNDASQFKRSEPYRNIFDLPKSEDI